MARTHKRLTAAGRAGERGTIGCVNTASRSDNGAPPAWEASPTLDAVPGGDAAPARGTPPAGDALASRAPGGPEVRLRPARTSDVRDIVRLVSGYAEQRILLAKERVTLFEDIQEFRVAEAIRPAGEAAESERRADPGAAADRQPADDGPELVGCGALHVMWEDLAEVRTLAVAPAWRGRGVGRRILEALVEQARDLGVRRVFCLTFEVDFFARNGFHAVDGTTVSPEVYAELLRSMDEGVAEFLDLARVKPNTLGNTRMIRIL